MSETDGPLRSVQQDVMTMTLAGFVPLAFRQTGLLDAVEAVLRLSPRPTARDRVASAADDREAQWIRAARGGDRDAFRHLVDRHRHRAFETALRIVGLPEEAEEAAQDAFVRAWRALPGFREEARFSTWLYRIVTRCAIDAARTAGRRRARETAVEPEVIESRAAPSPATVPDTTVRRLHAVLAELEPVPRAVVTLFYLRDRGVREVATILELPEGTVKTHLHRSRAAMRRAWERQETRQ